MIKHLEDAGENYFVHLGFTLKVAGYLIVTAFCAVIHGLFPVILLTTTSDRVIALADDIKRRRMECEAHKAKKSHE